MRYDEEYEERKSPYKKKTRVKVSDGGGHFIEKSKKAKRRKNKHRDKDRYDGKYDGWN